MRVEGQQVLLSASDLMRFMSCKHATALDLRYARGEPLVPADDTEDAKILQKQGDDHEFRYLSKLKAEGHSVIEFGRDGGLAAAAEATQTALSQGSDVLFQGAFFAPPWGGWSDFLVRVERPSNLGAFSYEVVTLSFRPPAVISKWRSGEAGIPAIDPFSESVDAMLATALVASVASPDKCQWIFICRAPHGSIRMHQALVVANKPLRLGMFVIPG